MCFKDKVDDIEAIQKSFSGHFHSVFEKYANQCISELLISLLYDCGNKDLRKIIPIRETVAGDAQLRSCVSKTKLTFGPNWIRSPEGIVSSLLSSRTELSDSIHSGSMSPSQTIHDWMFCGSFTTCRAAYVNTPSLHSRVSISIWPSSYKTICTYHHLSSYNYHWNQTIFFKYSDRQCFIDFSVQNECLLIYLSNIFVPNYNFQKY